MYDLLLLHEIQQSLMPVLLRCPHCFHEYEELKESQQEAMLIRIRETCPECGFSSTLADMHYIWKPDTE
jgi:ribosomal protein S27AE